MNDLVLVIHTGGTIAMAENKKTGEVNTVDEHPLNQSSINLPDGVKAEQLSFVNIPSPHVTPNIMYQLYQFIEEKIKLEHYSGIVITHGTDTLEETAYFLDLLHKNEVPIVITGSMRSSNELGYDGPHNLETAIRTASSKDARNQGVLVALNDEIHTAKNVTKTHTSNVATFQSPQFGPIGIVTKRGVFFHHRMMHREAYQIQKLTKRTALLKVYAGMDPDLLNNMIQMGYDGLVLEALGQGNVPPHIMEPIHKLLDHQIPIVVVSRCFNGVVQDVYNYEGGGMRLKEAGVIFTNGLNGQKARLKLMIALEAVKDIKELHQIFQH